MGISNLTAMTIQNRSDLLVSHGFCETERKYLGWITLPTEDNCRPLLNTKAIFNTADEAEKHMHELISKIKNA